MSTTRSATAAAGTFLTSIRTSITTRPTSTGARGAATTNKTGSGTFKTSTATGLSTGTGTAAGTGTSSSNGLLTKATGAAAGAAGGAVAKKASVFKRIILPILIVLVVLIVLVIAFLAFRHYKKKKAQEEAAAKAQAERDQNAAAMSQQTAGDPYNPQPNQYAGVDNSIAMPQKPATEDQLDGGAHNTRPVPTNGAAADYFTGHPEDNGAVHREVDRMAYIKEEDAEQQQHADGVLNKIQTSFGHHGEKR